MVVQRKTAAIFTGLLLGAALVGFMYLAGFPTGIPRGQAAVDLLYFHATAQTDRVHLEWETATELNTAAFYIRRTAGTYTNPGSTTRIPVRDSETNELLTLIPPRGEFLVGAYYDFYDPNAEPGKTYHYLLEEVDAVGSVSTYYGPETVSMAGSTYTPSPTSENPPTNTPTPTRTPSNTPTRTPTPSQTNTGTLSPTPTATNTPTSGPGATATRTPTSTPTSTITRRPTRTPIATLTPRRTNTPFSSVPTGQVISPNQTATRTATPGIQITLPNPFLTPGAPGYPPPPGEGYPPPEQPGFPGNILTETASVATAEMDQSNSQAALSLTRTAENAASRSTATTPTATLMPFPGFRGSEPVAQGGSDRTFTLLVVAGAALFLGGGLMLGGALFLYIRRPLTPTSAATITLADFTAGGGPTTDPSNTWQPRPDSPYSGDDNPAHAITDQSGSFEASAPGAAQPQQSDQPLADPGISRFMPPAPTSATSAATIASDSQAVSPHPSLTTDHEASSPLPITSGALPTADAPPKPRRRSRTKPADLETKPGGLPEGSTFGNPGLGAAIPTTNVGDPAPKPKRRSRTKNTADNEASSPLPITSGALPAENDSEAPPSSPDSSPEDQP